MKKAPDGSFFLFALILFPGGQTAPDVALALVFVQDQPHLGVQIRMALQPLGQILVDGGFGDAELLCRGANSSAGFDEVHSQVTGALVNVFFHRLPPMLCATVKPMNREAGI